ncbi:hypothetical protein [Methylobacterium sp. Leaf466]|uniref:hypothetical protein n=1 Tax=Methylobacterium sp. Leaf466 TaxID=1736386 RepID=UPI0006FA688A|nr:hypothetical protein [Methylobacterium sp. Leaf466]KQT78987.1 hypothetical protein ASG59_07480 [Methylobacterium sp. Leaf466]
MDRRSRAAVPLRGGVALAVVSASAIPLAAVAAVGQPLSLPTTLRATVQVPVQAPAVAPEPASSLRALYARLGACWQPPAGLARFERTEVTARFALRRDGSVIGEPRITFATQPSDGRAFRLLADAARDAIRRCTPAPITPGLGGAIAGRPIALRFIYQGPKGQGV